MIFVLGLLTGICLCIFIAVLYRRVEHSVVRKLDQIVSASSQRGSIIDLEENEVEQWVDSLKKE